MDAAGSRIGRAVGTAVRVLPLKRRQRQRPSRAMSQDGAFCELDISLSPLRLTNKVAAVFLASRPMYNCHLAQALS